MTLRYLAIRLLHSAAITLGVLALVFLVTHLLGDPVQIVLPPDSSQTRIDAVRKELGLDRPLIEQFQSFMADAARGTFGESFWQKRPAMELVLARIPATVYLAAVAMALILPLGIATGILAALRPGSRLERLIDIFSFMSVSVVGFWFALILIIVFSVGLRILPTSGYGGLEHAILPALTLAFVEIGQLAQVVRTAVADELTKSHVAAARARGIPERQVIVRYALRNALIPIVTVVGTLLTGLLNGAVIAETVFGWPGIGLMLIQSIEHRDLPLIEATVFVTAVMVTLINLLADMLYVLINPRVRLAPAT